MDKQHFIASSLSVQCTPEMRISNYDLLCRSADLSALHEVVTTHVLKGGGIPSPAMQASKGLSAAAVDGVLVVSNVHNNNKGL